MHIAKLPVSVRRDIARHLDTPARALAALVAADGPDIDPDLGVAWKVARHHNTPARALDRLSKCLGRRAVLCAVAEHHNPLDYANLTKHCVAELMGREPVALGAIPGS